MSLPKQTLPIFNAVIPSTKKKVKFRQFTVKEEKILAQAQQSEDLEVITNAIKEVVSSCVEGINDIDDLALFDIEYLMTKIRAKSVGEYVDLSMECEADPKHKRIPLRINLDEIEVTFHKDHSTKIDLYDDVGVVMRYPSLKNLKNFEEADGIDVIINCISHIYTQEEIFDAKEQTKEELSDFLSNLTSKQMNKIEDTFLKTIPTFEKNITYACSECGHTHEKILKGLANFFA